MEIDIRMVDKGTVWQVTPISERGQSWMQEHVLSEPRQWLGSTLVVDHYYAQPLLVGMKESGLVVEVNGQKED